MKLQVIKTDKGYIAIDKVCPVKLNEWCIEKWEGEGNYIDENGHNWFIRRMNMNCDVNDPECHKIIATDNSLKLEGIPQFELEKVEDVDTFVKSCLNEWGLVDTEPHNDLEKGRRIGLKIGLFYGYKASQEKGCYTEEDLRKAINNVFNIVFKNRLLIKEDLKRITYDIINSLKQPKQLVGIEVETQKIPVISDKEYEELEKGDRQHTDINPFTIEMPIPQTKSEEYPNGLLTVRQYYYSSK